jgi:hypothetical protein
MRQPEWGSFFNNISNQLTVSILACPLREDDPTNCIEVRPSIQSFQHGGLKRMSERDRWEI